MENDNKTNLELAQKHHRQKEWNEASHYYQKALKETPEAPEALFSYGKLLFDCGQFQTALAVFEKLLIQQSDHSWGYYHQALCFQFIEIYHEALQSLQKALQFQPDNDLFECQKGVIYNQMGDYQAAIKCFHTVLERNEKHVKSYNNLGQSYHSLGEWRKSIQCYQKALALEPKNLAILNNLGATYFDHRLYVEAEQCFQKALQIHPLFIPVLGQQGLLNIENRHYQKALAYYDQALQADPYHLGIHYYKSLTLFKLDQFELGWKEYEWQKHSPAFTQGPHKKHLWWKGQDLSGKTLLIQSEQGLGDQIMFSQAFPKTPLTTAKKVYLECHPKLFDLFKRSFPQLEVITMGTTVNVDYRIPNGSLSPYLKLRKNQSAGPGILIPCPQKSKTYQERLATDTSALKIGINWCSPSHINSQANSFRQKASTALKDWLPLFQIPQTSWYNLQYNTPLEEMQELQDQHGIPLKDWDDLDQTNDLDSLSALISHLDLVISINSTAGILAAALNVPTWILADFGLGHAYEPEHGETNPYPSVWFESIQYYRQQSAGEWNSAFQILEQDLKSRVRGRSSNSNSSP